jgi:mannose-6-phosphate isomerase
VSDDLGSSTMGDASSASPPPDQLPEPIDMPAAEWIVPPPPEGELPRTVTKPWGSEIIWAHTMAYVGKILTIATGKRLSLQYHEHKDEWIRVLDGRLLLTLQNDEGVVEERELGPGEGVRVRVGRVHRFEAIETCRLIEVSTPELEDVVRIQDDFGREGTNAP